MSRFKFRVWLIVHKRWATPDEIIDVMEPYRWVSCFDDNSAHGAFGFDSGDNTFVIVEQCTGLPDKNGVLIYEGDIVIYRCTFHRAESAVDMFGVEPQLEFDCGSDVCLEYVGVAVFSISRGVCIRFTKVAEYFNEDTIDDAIVTKQRGYKSIPCSNERCEVIGNIHEHAHLLEA